jgi:quercetin dioxygenase-like cupin family protein
MSTPFLGAVLTASLSTLTPTHTAPQAPAQTADVPTCLPMAQRTREAGCWIITDEPVGRLAPAPMFWHLDTFPTRAAAAAAKRRGAAVVESLGRFWLMTIAEAIFRAGSGEHVAEIGPLPISPHTEYSATYMEAIFTPGMESATHTHSGPEAWYTMSGETCLETPDGVMIGRAGGPPVIVPAGPPMHLTATGAVTRRALVLILHDRSQPPTTVTHAWTPKGLCNK